MDEVVGREVDDPPWKYSDLCGTGVVDAMSLTMRIKREGPW